MKYKLLYISLLIFILLGCKRHQDTKVPSVIPVEIVYAGDSDIINDYTYIGHVEAATSIPLSFMAGGNVTSVQVTAGQKVKKGQVIATVDDNTARNAYNAALATLNRAEDGYKRAKQVYDNGSMSEIQWVEIKSSLEQAESMAAISKKQLNDCVLRSPIDGTVSERYVDPGTNVLPSQHIVKIIDTDKMIVSFAIPEKEISKIKIGQSATITISALNNIKINGRITEQNITAQKLSHNYETKIALDSQVEGLLPGMVCNISLQSDIETSGINIPLRAVQMDNQGKRFLWIVQDSIAHRRYIKIGDLTDNGVIITEGIDNNDKVIVSGYLKISEGTKVSIRQVN